MFSELFVLSVTLVSLNHVYVYMSENVLLNFSVTVFLQVSGMSLVRMMCSLSLAMYC